MKFCISEPNLTTVINMEDIFRGMKRGTQFIFCPGLPQILVSYCNVYSLYQFIFCPGLPQILVSYCNVYSLFQFWPLGHCCICWQVNVYWTDNMLSDMTICFLLMLMCFCYGNHKLINEVQVNEHCGRWQFVSRSILYEERDLLNKYRIWSLSFSSFFFSFADKSFRSWNNSSM